MWQPGLHKGFGVFGETGHASLVRAAHARLRRHGRVLPRRVQVGRAHDERHAGVPLHDATARTTDAARRHHGRARRSSRRHSRELVGLLRRRRHRQGARADRRPRRHGDRTRRRTRRTAGWRGPPIRPVPCSSSAPACDRSRDDPRSVRYGGASAARKERVRMTGTAKLDVAPSSSASSSTGPS